MRKIFRRAFVALLCVLMLATCALPASAKTFSDVVAGTDWFHSVVTYMSEKGIIDGHPDGTFRPLNYVTRAQFIKMMTMTFGLEPSGSINYSDVKSTDWFYDNYRAAANEGFLKEVFTGSRMEPNKELTREEAVALLMAYLDYPEEAVESASYFSDYYSIDSDFRDYVLQATKAKIIDGFPIEGSTKKEFRPEESLRRSQAAKILAVAAGTIVNDDISDDLESVDSQNLVVNESCVVKNLTIGGNVIISSGVNGTVTFTNCEIGGFVSNRSTQNIIFSNCIVNELNVDVASASVDLKQSNINELNVNGRNATITFYTKSSVDTLNVDDNCTGVSVKGAGTIESLKVNAGTFNSVIIPLECEIKTGISAVIDNVTYKDGVKGAPTTEWSSDDEYLKIETYIDGTVCYYYTSSSTVPQKTAFNTNYSSATTKDSFAVVADRAYNVEIKTSDLEKEPYVVVALLDGGDVVSTPVVINREASKYGFNVSPVISVSSGKDQIALTPKTAGTLYYYYTFETKVPSSYSSAMSDYNDADNAVKGTLSYSSAASSKQSTKSVSDVSSYTYCVMFFLGEDGTRYSPVMVERPYMTSGLSAEPYVIMGKKDDEHDILTITAASGGYSVKWFYTNSTANFNSSFETEYSATDKALKGTKSLSANKETEVELAKLSDAKKYEYVIIKFGNNLPIRLQRRTSVTGFDTTPVVMKTSEEDLITFDSIGSGTVWYMYVDKNMSFTTESFMSVYNATDTKYKNTYTASGSSQNYLSAEDSEDISYSYVAFMFKNTYGEHKPVTVARNAIGNGFKGTPVVEYDVDTGITTLKLNANSKYEIQYFPTNTYYTGDALVSEFRHNEADQNIGSIGVDKVVVGAKDYNLKDDYNLKITKQYSYVAIRAKYNNDVMFSPVIVPVNVIDDGLVPESEALGSKAAITFSYSDVYDHVRISANPNTYGGTFQYFYSKTEPKSAANYNTIFNNATLPSGSIDLNTPNTGAAKLYEFNTVRSSSVVDYGYFVYRIIDANGKSMTAGYVEIGLAHRQRATVNSSSAIQFNLKFRDGESLSYTVKWFYSETQIKDLKISDFDSKYNIAGRKNTASEKFNGTEKDVKGSVLKDATISTGFVQQYKDEKPVYNYMYIVLVDASGNKFQPIEFVVPGTPTSLVPTT